MTDIPEVDRLPLKTAPVLRGNLKLHMSSMRRAGLCSLPTPRVKAPPTAGEILKLSCSEAKKIVHPGGDVLNGVAY